MIRMIVVRGLWVLLMVLFSCGQGLAVVEEGALSGRASELQVAPTAGSDAALAPEHKMSKREKAPRFKEGEILVRFRDGIPNDKKEKLHKRHGSKKLKAFKSVKVEQVKLKRGLPVEAAIELYQAEPDVEYAEPNFRVEALVTPNDPDFNVLWGLNNEGQSGGSTDADIDAPEAWDIATGSQEVVVAVLDTGIDYLHGDLAANIWTNPEEIASNGVDDDNNGYVDDIYGIDTANGDSVPMDDNGHGTHVAGTIGAVGNNGTGIAGVNWQVKILACKFLNSEGSGYIDGAVECLDYIKEKYDDGLNVVATNNSWGAKGESLTLAEAIASQREILFVAAAGNDDLDNDESDYLPSNIYLPNVLSVVASDDDDEKAHFSNYGRRSTHLAAPGLDIYSTLPGSSYGSHSGTSMAAPHVAGLAALLQAQDPGRDWRSIRNLILAGGDSRASLAGISVTGRRANAFGSMTCSDNAVFSALKIPSAIDPGVTEVLSAISIECENPAGPVTVTTSAGGMLTLLDNGADPDLAEGDGIFSGYWTPVAVAERLTFCSPLGTEVLVIPALKIVDTYLPEGNIHAGYSHVLQATGGLAPYTWIILSGSLPPGLHLDAATGEIYGHPEATGDFEFTLQVQDSLGVLSEKAFSLSMVDSPVAEVWREYFDDGDRDHAGEIAVDEEGNVYVVGFNGDTIDGWFLGEHDYVLLKYDPEGILLWEKVFDANLETFYIYEPDIALDSAGNIIMTGFVSGPDYLVVKHDPSGNVLWTKTYDSSGWDIAYDVVVDNDDNIIVTGDTATIKYDPLGNVLWMDSLENERGRGAAVDGDGNVYIAGIEIDEVAGRARPLTKKYDPSGTLTWSRTYEHESFGDYPWALGVDVDESGNVYVAGTIDIAVVGGFAIKYDSAGTLAWTQTLPRKTLDIQVGADRYLYLLQEFFVYKLAPEDGAEIWSINHGGYGLTVDGQYNFYLVGNLFANGDRDISMYKYSGYLVTTGNLAYGNTGSAYSETLQVGGGVPPYAWQVTSGALPPGLSLEADGEIHGFPTALGTYEFSVGVTDARSVHASSLPLSITISHIVTDSLEPAPVGIIYSQSLQAEGGAGPFTWSTVSGQLPPGLTLDQETGAITGIPTLVDNFSVGVEMADGLGGVSTRQISIPVFDTVQTYGGAYNQEAYSAAADGAGHYFVGGVDSSNTGLFLKYDKYNNVMYSRKLPTTYINSKCTDLTLDGLGNIFATGREYTADNGENFLAVKYNEDGDVLWSDSYAGIDSHNISEASAMGPDGSLYLTGFAYGADGDRDFLTIKYTAGGEVAWSKTFDNGPQDYAYGIAVTGDGDVYVGGQSGYDFAVVKYDPNGEELWRRFYDRGGNESIKGLASAPDGGLYLCADSSAGGRNLLIVKLDADGEVVWETSYDSGSYDYAGDISLDAKGMVYVVGSAYNGNDYDVLTLYYDAQGNLVWSKQHDGGSEDWGRAIAVDPQGATVLVAGYSGMDISSRDVLTLRYYPPQLASHALPSGVEGQPFGHQFLPEGGAPPYTFAVWSGSLPEGLQLDAATGEFSGIPTTPGAYQFAVKVGDAASLASIEPLSMTVDYASPLAAFTVSTTTGQAPCQMTFADASTGHPSSWTWDFGDGTTGTGHNPNHLYTAAGSYDVTLTVSNAAGSDTLTVTDYITALTCNYLPVRLEGGAYHADIARAYAAASGGDAILLQAGEFLDDLLLNREIDITLKGGHVCDFSSSPGESVIRAGLTIRSGKVKIENVRFR